MVAVQKTPWYQARKAPFEAFGILYYPLFAHRSDLEGVELDDADMTWAMTANVNLEGTGYTLSQTSILALAAYHHHMAGLAATTGFLPVTDSLGELGVNPLADVQRFVPDVTASPMYPDFPSQVMEMDEATFRYHQSLHYASTYGVELVAGLCGLDVTVTKGWMPDVESTPKTEDDEALVAPKVLHLILTVEDLRSVVEARLARATRMHPAEIASALLVFTDLGDEAGEVSFPIVAFHENMMELIRVAAEADSATLTRVAGGLAQHPGDLLKATTYVLDARGRGHLATRQKKGLCNAFERFETMAIAHNIADAGKKERRAPLFLSVERFAGPHLARACELVWSGEVVSWGSQLERLWTAVEEPRELGDAWRALLSHYGKRPGILLRSLTRLTKHGCPAEPLREEVLKHAASYSLPTLVRLLTIMSEPSPRYRMVREGYASWKIGSQDAEEPNEMLCSLLRELIAMRLAELDTPLKGKRVHLDTAGVSLSGSTLMPNDTGNTGTAWPPVGMAYELPDDQYVRFFTFWNNPKWRVDVDLHFIGIDVSGDSISIGWNSSFKTKSMATSGDVTTSDHSVEYLDVHMGRARKEGVLFVVQIQHIFNGSRKWEDIETCYSGALAVGRVRKKVKLYNAQNLLFRDDLTGSGTKIAYAVVNFPNHYVRILRGANLPVGDVGFALGDYLAALFEAQGVTPVAAPEEADVRVCVGRSDDPTVVSLFDEGFYLG